MSRVHFVGLYDDETSKTPETQTLDCAWSDAAARVRAQLDFYVHFAGLGLDVNAAGAVRLVTARVFLRWLNDGDLTAGAFDTGQFGRRLLASTHDRVRELTINAGMLDGLLCGYGTYGQALCERIGLAMACATVWSSYDDQVRRQARRLWTSTEHGANERLAAGSPIYARLMARPGFLCAQ